MLFVSRQVYCRGSSAHCHIIGYAIARSQLCYSRRRCDGDHPARTESFANPRPVLRLCNAGPVPSRSGDVRSCFLELPHPCQSRRFARMSSMGLTRHTYDADTAACFRSAAPKTPDPGAAKEETSPQPRTSRLRSPLSRADLKIRTTMSLVRLTADVSCFSLVACNGPGEKSESANSDFN